MSDERSSNPRLDDIRRHIESLEGSVMYGLPTESGRWLLNEVERLTAENAAMRRKMQESPGAADETSEVQK